MTAGPTQVVDASVVVGALIDSTRDGEWALDCLEKGRLASPHLMPFEAANIIRRSAARGAIEQSEGANALHYLDLLEIDLIPFTATAIRIWELRDNLTCYDAAYVVRP